MDGKDKYRVLFEDAPFVIMILDENAVVEEVNPAITDWLGYEISGFTGKSFEQLPGLLDAVDYSTIVENDNTFYVRFQSIDKQIKTGKVSKQNILRKGLPAKTALYIQDVGELLTERRKQHLLKQFVVNIYNSPAKTTIILDDRNTIVKINDNAVRLLARKRKEVIGQPVSRFLNLDKQALSALRRNSGKPEQLETTLCGTKGEEVPILLKLSKIHHSGKSFSFLCILDISDRKKIENQLKRSEERFRQLSENNDEVFWIADTEDIWHITYISPAFETIWGISPDELYKNPRIWRETIYQKDREYVEIQLQRFFKKQQKLDIKYRITHKDGTLRWVWNKGFYIHTGKGKQRQAAGIIQDITLQQYMQEALMETSNKYKNLFELVSEAILVVHPRTYSIVEANRAACQMFKYGYDELPGISLTTLAVNPEEMQEALRQSPQQQAIRIHHKTKDRHIFPATFLSSRVRIENEDFLLCSIRDISDQIENEKKILKAILAAEERERKRIAADIHDEIGPALSGIMMYVNKIIDPETPPALEKQLKEYLREIINKTIRRTKNISISLMPNLLTEYGVPKAINNFCRQINSLNEVNINFHYNKNFRLEEDIEINVYRILIELIHNSLKHSGATRIDIELKKTKTGLQIDFRDNGSGFDLQKILQENNGLGLRNILSRIRSIHGEYLFESQDNKGIHFTITLKTNTRV